ncbi:MAG: enoyl-CoA hydratase/isomerase family protein [Gammaproteobacteria bacterium]|nr:enoyl-CoA hydratase/isomerase family protein [Gammaproteobacteria bacterium]
MTQPTNDERAPVLLFEHETSSGHVLAEAHLHVEATLNSLSLDMIDIIHPALDAWAARPEVVAVLFTGAGDRAFCAGGDIQALYHAMVRNHEQGEVVDEYPFEFFEREYRFDYRIHTYPKPVIAVGHGVVMGGGLGILSAARYRVVTERSRIAMPEVTIGLFPDAGQTWLLRNMPRHHATFLGVTGSHMNGTDALAVGLGTHGVAIAARGEVRDLLCSAAWGGDPDEAVGAALAALTPGEFPDSQVQHIPESLGTDGELGEVVATIEALQGSSDWIDRGIAAMQGGCPTTVGIVVEQLKRAGAMELADTFRLEMTVATHCANNHDFAEGVRALLIEKDNAPRWQFDDLASLPLAYVDSHFVEPWSQNPLADLG